MKRTVDPAMFDPEFFPTPRGVANLMLAKIDQEAVHYLEPSAGRGDLAEAIKERGRYGYGGGSRSSVDCIEQSPELIAILQSKEFPVVGYDWLDYSGVCYYDAIVANPPFSNGDKHLLKMWDFMHDGEIVCLLNEETIKNPYSESRRRLAGIIKDHAGTVEFLGDCFSTAIRTTTIKVAMVYLKKVSGDDTVDLWETKTEEKDVNDDVGSERNFLALKDTLGNMQHYYDQANEHMLKAFQHLRKAAIYMDANGISNHSGTDYKQIAGMGLSNQNAAKAEFIQKHRKDAWKRVFDRMDFHKWLDQKQTQEFIRDIERNGNIPFTKENIKGTLENVFQQRGKLFDISVANVFDELTRYYKGNHYGGGGAVAGSTGWKSNDSYKVNRKLVFPWGCNYDSKYFNKFELRWGGSDIDIYTDLDRVLCVLDGAKFETCYTIQRMLRAKFDSLGTNVRSPFDNTAESQYFEIRFFKKGTVHLTFKHEHLWEKFNITAAKGKAWLGENTRDERKPEQSNLWRTA